MAQLVRALCRNHWVAGLIPARDPVPVVAFFATAPDLGPKNNSDIY